MTRLGYLAAISVAALGAAAAGVTPMPLTLIWNATASASAGLTPIDVAVLETSARICSFDGTPMASSVALFALAAPTTAAG